MELTYIIATVIKSMGVSLGVGSSTLAILHFFKAIADGNIDQTEREMLGVIYIVLRVSMVILLLTSLIQAVIWMADVGTGYFVPRVFALWILIGVLYGNAILMTMRKMPSSVGPALQASSWYALGIFSSIAHLGIAFSFTQFMATYLMLFVAALILVNGYMFYTKSQQQTPTVV